MAIKYTIKDIQLFLGRTNCKIIGNKKQGFKTPVSIFNPLVSSDETFTFCAKDGEKGTAYLEHTNSSVIICGENVPIPICSNKTFIRVKNPRLSFIRCMNHFFPKEQRGIHPSVHIDDSVKIGKNVTINAYSVIGSEGFGYVRNEEKTLEKFEHIGGVIIEDDVAIGALTTVDRGTLSNTIIGEGTKIDSHVHVGHNVVIGKYCIITAFSMLGGSAKIGDYCWIAPCACIRDGITIGKNVLVGMGAVVTKDVPDDDIVIGVPAKSMK